MNPNLKVFVEVCKEKNVPYRIIHECGNLLEVKSTNGEPQLFTIGTTPFNSHSIVTLCKDKEFFYNYYKETLRMPKTKGFLNPNCNPEYQNLVKYKSYADIIKETEKNFSYPLIVKMNRGSQGKCVFKVQNQSQFKEALSEIYKEDYIALTQECVDIKSEYRVIFLDKKLLFAYKKNNEHAKFVGNISPLHFEGAFAEIVTKPNLLNAFDKFIQPLLAKKNIRYLGADIVLDKNNLMWLIEGNCSPGFDYLLQNPKGKDLLKGLYTEMFKSLEVLPNDTQNLLLSRHQEKIEISR